MPGTQTSGSRLGDAPGPRTDSGSDAVEHLLQLARIHLGMELSWVSRFDDDAVVVAAISGGADELPLTTGFTSPLGDSYFIRVRDRSGSPLITDPADDPVVRSLSGTRDFAPGSYVGVPLQRPSGEIIGTLCCINRDPDPGMRLRDAQFLQLLADLITVMLDGDAKRSVDDSEREQIQAVLDQGGPRMVLQSIHALPDLRVVGYEALARFDDGTPDLWFDRARQAGLGADLELAAVRNALGHLPDLEPGEFLSINVSPDVVSHPDLAATLGEGPLDQVVLEINEHEKVADYAGLRAAMDHWRSRGVRFAVDDGTTAYSGMRRLIELRPELIKLDRSITHGLDMDPARFAMATALAAFAREIGSGVIAEGVETASELAKALELQIPLVQGYHLGRPAERPTRTGHVTQI